MEKPSKLKSKFLRFLLHAASAVTFKSPPALSPRKATAVRGSSGPIISIILKEVRRRPKNGSFDAREPTSPKVSCMGQVRNTKKAGKPKLALPPLQSTMQVSFPTEAKEQQKQGIIEIFKVPKQGGKVNGFCDKPTIPERLPCLGQMKQFSSARGALANFDWRAHAVVVVPDCQDGCLYEEKDGMGGEEEKVIIPFSAPLVMSGGVAVEPKKEVNLWKRRTTSPMLLQL